MGNISPEQRKKILSFLKHHPMGILSTVTPDGGPWGAAIYYVADENFNFYFVTRVETLKYHNLDTNPVAALTIADPETQVTVQASGHISEVPVEDYTDIVFNKLAKIKPKDDPHWAPPLAKIHKGNYMPLCLTPTKMQYADFKQHKPEIHADYIQKIIP